MATPFENFGLSEQELARIGDVWRLPRPEGTEGGPRIQVDSWEADGFHYVGFAAQGKEEAGAFVGGVNLASGEWHWLSTVLATCASHHDIRAVVGKVALLPATSQDMVDLGLIGGASGLAQRIFTVLSAQPPTRTLFALPGTGKSHFLQAMGRMHRVGSARESSPEPANFGYPKSGFNRWSGPEGGRGMPTKADGEGGTPAGVHAIDMALEPLEVIERLTAIVDDAMEVLRPYHHAEASDALGVRNWSLPGYLHLAAPGRTGERRRQAARMYPAHAPMLRHYASISGLIDAGRPFERTLRDALSDLVRDGRADALTLAGLRRMRHLTTEMSFETVCSLADLAARLPVDWLPVTDAGWKALDRVGGILDESTRGMGLDIRDVFARTRWDWEACLAEMLAHKDDPQSFIDMQAQRKVFGGARDMARRMADTLVLPLMASVGYEPEGRPELTVASTILFGGKTFATIGEMQARWHRNLVVLEGALPSHETSNTWPAAFAPFTALNGLVIACLTSEAELKAEGLDGPDADGNQGLDHCVGGSARECYAGSIHVASVRRPLGHGFERVSTVQLSAYENVDERIVLTVTEHRASGNDDPCQEAEEAVMQFIEALHGGDHPLNAEALVERSDDGFLDVYDWRTPGALERAFSAWAPYLPRHVVNAGAGGLAGRLPDLVEALPLGAVEPLVRPILCMMDPTEMRIPASLQDMMEDGVLDIKTTGLDVSDGILRF